MATFPTRGVKWEILQRNIYIRPVDPLGDLDPKGDLYVFYVANHNQRAYVRFPKVDLPVSPGSLVVTAKLLMPTVLGLLGRSCTPKFNLGFA